MSISELPRGNVIAFPERPVVRRVREFVEAHLIKFPKAKKYRSVYTICLKDDEVAQTEIFYTDFADQLRQQREFEETIPKEKFIDIGWP